MAKKVYTKIHELKKAADSHERLIKKRGGKVKREKLMGSGKIKLTYTF